MVFATALCDVLSTWLLLLAVGHDDAELKRPEQE